MFKAPSDYTIEKVIITEDSVTKGDEPIILRNPNKIQSVLLQVIWKMHNKRIPAKEFF